MKKLSLFIIICITMLIVGYSVVNAQTASEGVIIDPLGGRTIPQIINLIITNILAPIGFGLAVIMIIWSGILYMTAGADEEKVRRAKKTLIWTVIGLVILISANLIVMVICNTFGVTCNFLIE